MGTNMCSMCANIAINMNTNNMCTNIESKKLETDMIKHTQEHGYALFKNGGIFKSTLDKLKFPINKLAKASYLGICTQKIHILENCTKNSDRHIRATTVNLALHKINNVDIWNSIKDLDISDDNQLSLKQILFDINKYTSELWKQVEYIIRQIENDEFLHIEGNCCIICDPNSTHSKLDAYETVLGWHRDMTMDPNKHYDYLLMVLLDVKNMSPHDLLLGKVDCILSGKYIDTDTVSYDYIAFDNPRVDIIATLEAKSLNGYLLAQNDCNKVHTHSPCTYNPDSKRHKIICKCIVVRNPV